MTSCPLYPTIQKEISLFLLGTNLTGKGLVHPVLLHKEHNLPLQQQQEANNMKRSASETQINSNKDKRYKRPKAPPPSPAFADVTASVIAATFAARRLPELQQVLPAVVQRASSASRQTSSLLDTRGFQSGGHKASKRHLRRRVTSFQRRQRHRYPTNTNKKTETTTTTTTATPPSSNTLQHQQNENTKQTTRSRRTRRKNKRQLQATHSQWRWLPTDDNDSEAITAPTHWIPTHIWHAKRFRMHDLWGWQVPLLHTNRGTQAAVRLVSKDEKCLVQDVTWRVQPVSH